MVFGVKWGTKAIVRQILANEKGIGASKIAPHQSIAFFDSEEFNICQARAELDGIIPNLTRIISGLPFDVRRDAGIIFDDYHGRAVFLQALPELVCVLINIEGKKIEILRKLQLIEQWGDVLSRHKCAKK